MYSRGQMKQKGLLGKDIIPKVQERNDGILRFTIKESTFDAK